MLFLFFFLKIGAETHVEKVLVGLAIACFSVVAEYVLIVGAVNAHANHRVAVLSERAHARQLARYLKRAHRVACLEQLRRAKSQIGKLELPIELLIGQVVDVYGAFVAARTQVASVSTEIDTV